MDLFKNALQNKPIFSVITGAVNSGKSTLLTELTHSLRRQHIPVLNINLRSVSFNSVDSTLEDKGNTWFKQFKKAAQYFKLNAKGYGFQLSIGVAGQEIPPIVKLNKLLHLFEAKLPPHTFWHGAKAPLFIIDEANELRALSKDPNGNEALHNLFKCLVVNTKVRSRFHILFSSSDSFFHLWVSKYIGSTQYETYVIGDLAQQEALNFWNYLLERLSWDGPLPEFETIYNLCKGNMFLIQRALLYWISECQAQFVFQWNMFPYVVQETAKLTRAYYRLSDLTLYETTKSCPLWTKENLVNIMSKLVSSEGYMMYDDLCEQIGAPVVDSFIEHNILHLRPTRRCTHDLPAMFYDKLDDVPVVTAEFACGLMP